jgi:electron transport complex protein RnfB
MLLSEEAPRKKLPKELAVIDPDRCTGCEACVEICPVDCILSVRPQPRQPWERFCQVDWDRCIGCGLCIRIPGKRRDPYELRVCPWEAITMVPVARLPEIAERMSGPTAWDAQDRNRLREAALRQVELACRG